MDFSNTPKGYLLGMIGVMVLILFTVIATNPGTWQFRDTTDYSEQKKQAEAEAKQYQALLDSVQPDYEASQQLLEKIASEEIVRAEIESTLNTNQKLQIPTVPDSEVKLAKTSDRSAVTEYLNNLGALFTNYNTEVKPALDQVYADNADAQVIDKATTRTTSLYENLRGLPVPKDAVTLHKAYLSTYQTYGTFLGTASQYASGANSDPWAKVYGQYAVIDNRLALANTELSKLNNKFALDKVDSNELANNAFIKTANAQFAVVDVQAAAIYGIKVGLARSFAHFSIAMLDKLVAHIEKNFAIASQLYYSQDLGRFYSVEYMKKFVSDPLDQSIIQKFLPQYFCVNPTAGELKKIFVAKAAENIGTDIVIDPNDPKFLQKLAKLGADEKSYPAWWEEYYLSLAATTQQQAEAAATKEVLSPGLKTGRNLITGEINKTMSSIFNVQEAAINGTLNLGTNNTENAIGQLVASVVESLVNKFVFTPIGGGTSGVKGGIGVLGETNVCLRTPQIKPIAPLPSSTYPTPENSPATPTSTTPSTPVTGTPPFAPR